LLIPYKPHVGSLVCQIGPSLRNVIQLPFRSGASHLFKGILKSNLNPFCQYFYD
jgi:hypothetical protein